MAMGPRQANNRDQWGEPDLIPGYSHGRLWHGFARLLPCFERDLPEEINLQDRATFVLAGNWIGVRQGVIHLAHWLWITGL